MPKAKVRFGRQVGREPAQEEDEFTPEQRAIIDQIVRNMMSNDPQLWVDADTTRQIVEAHMQVALGTADSPGSDQASAHRQLTQWWRQYQASPGDRRTVDVAGSDRQVIEEWAQPEDENGLLGPFQWVPFEGTTVKRPSEAAGVSGALTERQARLGQEFDISEARRREEFAITERRKGTEFIAQERRMLEAALSRSRQNAQQLMAQLAPSALAPEQEFARGFEPGGVVSQLAGRFGATFNPVDRSQTTPVDTGVDVRATTAALAPLLRGLGGG